MPRLPFPYIQPIVSLHLSLLPSTDNPLQGITNFFKKIRATVPDMPSWWEKDKDRDGGEGCESETSDSSGGWGGDSGGDSGGDGGGD